MKNILYTIIILISFSMSFSFSAHAEKFPKGIECLFEAQNSKNGKSNIASCSRNPENVFTVDGKGNKRNEHCKVGSDLFHPVFKDFFIDFENKVIRYTEIRRFEEWRKTRHIKILVESGKTEEEAKKSAAKLAANVPRQNKHVYKIDNIVIYEKRIYLDPITREVLDPKERQTMKTYNIFFDGRIFMMGEHSPESIIAEFENMTGNSWINMRFGRCKIINSNDLSHTADYQVATDAYDAGDYETAYKEFKILADQGNAEAQASIGGMYDYGVGVIQNYKEAEKWYRLAAEQGEADAQTNLGFIYQRGNGVAQNYKEAVKWYRFAAEQGEARGQMNLAILTVIGKGVTQDYIMGYMWLTIAMTNENQTVDGMRKIKTIRKETSKFMTSEQIAEAQKLANECIKKNYKDCG